MSEKPAHGGGIESCRVRIDQQQLTAPRRIAVGVCLDRIALASQQSVKPRLAQVEQAGGRIAQRFLDAIECTG